jgi:hypothetical protein
MSYSHTVQSVKKRNEHREHQKIASTDKKHIGKMMSRKAKERESRPVFSTEISGPAQNQTYTPVGNSDDNQTSMYKSGTIFVPGNI